MNLFKQIPLPSSWQDYEAREFADIEIIYSSIVYWFDVCKIVSYVARTYMNTGNFGDALISSIDAKIAAWNYLLPACKKDPMRVDGTVDEVMFMAHEITAVYV